MKSGGNIVGRVGGKPQVASKTVLTSKKLQSEMQIYGRLKRELLRNPQNIKNMSNGIKRGTFPLKRTYDARVFARYANKYGFQLVMRGKKLVGFKFFMKGKRVAPKMNLLGGPGFQAQAGKQRFLPLYKRIPQAVRSAFNKLSSSKTNVVFISVRAAGSLAKSAGKVAVLLDAAGYKLANPSVMKKLKKMALQQEKLEFNVSVQKGRAAMPGVTTDAGAMQRANGRLAKFKASYGNPLALYKFAKANGGLLIK